MRAIAQDRGELLSGIGRTKGVCLSTHLFEGQSSLPDGARRAVGDILTDDGEGTPEGISLEGQDDLYTGSASHVLDQAEVASQQILLQYIAGGGKLSLIVRCQYFVFIHIFCKIQR